MKPIYLDYNASTPIDSRVRQAMEPYLAAHYGNPSSGHWAGRPAREAVEKARGQVAGLLGSSPDEIVFTSGGSEANNLAIKGVYWAWLLSGIGAGPAHIITSAIEHPAVLNPCRFLARLGVELTIVGVDGKGRVDPEEVRKALRPNTILVSVMHANNEVGTIQEIRAIADLAHEQGALMHTDAAQSAGKIPTDVNELGVDLLSIAGHKLYAPKGVGALYIREGVAIEPLVHGAGHESGRRAGTENVLLDVALGEACEVAREQLGMPEIRRLRDLFWQGLENRFGDRVVRNGDPDHVLPNTLNVSFVGRVGAEILAGLEGVAASTGSACHADRVELSPVLAAMGIPEREGMGAIRFSLGRGTTALEIRQVLDRLEEVLT